MFAILTVFHLYFQADVVNSLQTNIYMGLHALDNRMVLEYRLAPDGEVDR